MPQESEQALQATQESLDKVRDILFGSQLRQQDSRFAQLEEKVAGHLAAFRDETRKQLDTLQEFARTEFAAMTTRLAAETQQRIDALQHLGDELRSADRGHADRLEHAARTLSEEFKSGLNHLSQECTSSRNALEGRVAAADQQHAGLASELRAQLLEHINRLREENKQTESQLHATLEKLVGELRSAKMDRSTLASLFTDMAGRLQA
jgi:uncharacterized phage infection (PIP) family protein YhgE